MRRLPYLGIVLYVISVSLITNPPQVSAQALPATSQDTYYKARVEKIIDSGSFVSNGIEIPYQHVQATVLDGALKGRSLAIDHGTIFTIDKSKFVFPGQTVVVVQTNGPNSEPIYQIIDVYRLDALIPFLVLFAFAVIFLSQWRGVGSLVGMAISLLVIARFIVPQIMTGHDPLTISIAGCLMIMTVTVYLAHGFSYQTTVALTATFFTLTLTGLLSVLLVKFSHLTGLGSDDAYSLKLGVTAMTNFKGLLLGGILIGALGVLDDVTTGLTASLFEIHKANNSLSFSKLVQAGLRIGREHVSSLVNTLVLAYAGTSLPIFIILITNTNNYPLWSTLNSEMIVEEIVRTLSGSFGLILAVPLTTILAAWYLSNKKA